MIISPNKSKVRPKGLSLFLVETDVDRRSELWAKLQRSCRSFILAGEAGSGSALIKSICRSKPDVVVIGDGSCKLNFGDVIAHIKDYCPDTKVIAIAEHFNDRDVLCALEAGAEGYYFADVTGKQLAAAIKAVNLGSVCMDPAIMQRVSEFCPFQFAQAESRSTEGTSYSKLSHRELQVLPLVVEGYSNREVAERLNVSCDTVKTHLRHIMRKLSVSDRTQVAVKAIREKMVRGSCYHEASQHIHKEQPEPCMLCDTPVETTSYLESCL